MHLSKPFIIRSLGIVRRKKQKAIYTLSLLGRMEQALKRQLAYYHEQS